MLTKKPARALTDREIAKLIGSLLGGLAEYCDPQAIMRALDHFTEHRAEYERLTRHMSQQAENIRREMKRAMIPEGE